VKAFAVVAVSLLWRIILLYLLVWIIFHAQNNATEVISIMIKNDKGNFYIHGVLI